MSYFEVTFIRFLSWPKTILFGNQFHAKKSGDTYVVQKLPKKSAFYFEPRRQSFSEMVNLSILFKKVVACILYPFFNPFAFLLRSLQMSLFGAKVKQSSLQVTNEGKQLKQNILEKINKTKILVKEKTAGDVMNQFSAKEEEIRKKWQDLSLKISTVDSWKNPEIKKEFSGMFQKAADNFAYFLVALQKCVEEQQLDTPEKLAIQMAAQQGAKVPISFPLQYSTLILLYELIRNGSYWEKLPEGHDTSNGTHYTKTLRNNDLHKNVPEFYTQGTSEYRQRQTYNTYMKYLYRQFGGEKLKEILSGHDYTKGGERRIVNLTKVDTSKEETSYFGMINSK